MPAPPEDPMPLRSSESRFVPPLDAQEASYLAASARISSLLFRSMPLSAAFVWVEGQVTSFHFCSQAAMAATDATEGHWRRRRGPPGVGAGADDGDRA